MSAAAAVGCRYRNVRVRPPFLWALAVAETALTAYLVVPAELGRRDRAALAEAHRLARDLSGVPTESDRDWETVTAEVVMEFRTLGYRVTPHCGEYVLNGSIRMRQCDVRAGTGRGHGVLVTVSESLRGGERGAVRGGSWLRVSAD